MSTSGENENHDDDLLAGRYRIIEKLGEGGVAVVYKAHDNVLDKDVAIKKIQHTPTGTEVLRFQKEAKVAGSLVHPNILGVIDFGLTRNNEFYLVLNLINGESLSDRIKRTGPLPLFDAVHVFIQIVTGLVHAHNHKVIHRDIKPNNIMLLDDSAGGIEVQIVDFGLAKSLDQDQNLTKSGVSVGTPRYMSPEQIRGERTMDERTDIYSTGCLMFEALTGKPPFDGGNVMQTLQLHLSGDIPSLSESAGKEFPSKIEKIVRTCLEKEPQLRYQSASALLEELDEFLDHLHTTSGEPIDSSKFASKRRSTAGGVDDSNSSSSLDTPAQTARGTSSMWILLTALASVVLLFCAIPLLWKYLTPESAPQVKLVDGGFVPRSKKELFDTRAKSTMSTALLNVKEDGALNSRKKGADQIVKEMDSSLKATSLDGLFGRPAGSIGVEGATGSSGADPGGVEGAANRRDAEAAADAKRIPPAGDKDISGFSRDIEFFDSVDQEFADKSVSNPEGAKNEWDSLDLGTAFKKNRKMPGCLEAIDPQKKNFQDLSHFKDKTLVTTIRFKGSINLAPGAIPFAAQLNPRFLSIINSQFSDATFADLLKLPSVRELTLVRVTIPPNGHRIIARMKQLEKLNLNADRLNDRVMAAVGELTQLNMLELDHSEFSSKGFAHIAKLKNLKKLHMNEVKLVDQFLPILKGHPNLQIIQMSNCTISDKGLKYLESIKSLVKVNLSGSTVSRAAVISLRKALPNAFIADNNMKLYQSERDSLASKNRPAQGSLSKNSSGKSAESLSSNAKDQTNYFKIDEGGFVYSRRNDRFWADEPNDADLENIVKLKGPAIRKIKFIRSEVSPRGYALLKKSPLTFIEFEDTYIDYAILTALGNLPELNTVVFTKCPAIDFSHLKELSKLRRLHELVIENVTLSRSDMMHIAEVRKIVELKLDYCRGLTADNLSALTLPRLGALHVVSTDFNDAGLRLVSQWPLDYFVLSDTQITKEGLAAFLRSKKKLNYVAMSLSRSITLPDYEKLKLIRKDVELSLEEKPVKDNFLYDISPFGDKPD